MSLATTLLPAAVRVRLRSIVQLLDGTWIARHPLRRIWPEQFAAAPEQPLAGRAIPPIGARFNPIRFPQRGRGSLSVDRFPPVDDRTFDRLVRRARRRLCVSVSDRAGTSPGATEALTALALAGAPIQLSPARAAVASGDQGELLRQAAAPDVAPLDARTRELRSIRLRRCAHDLVWHPTGFRPCISVLLATKRPADVPNALRAVRSQRDCVVELLVGLHGNHWTDAEIADVRAATDGVVRAYDDATTLGAVLDDLTDRAGAALVSKWDDDDFYGGDHLADLVRAHEYSGADIVGKAAEFVYLEAADVTIRRSDVGAETYSWSIAGGTLLTSVDALRRIGGWPHVRRSVDQAVLQSARTAGLRAYRTHGFQYVLRRREDSQHTWPAEDAYFLGDATDRWPGRRIDIADIGADP